MDRHSGLDRGGADQDPGQTRRLAKKSPRAAGVLDLSAHPEWIEPALRRTDIADIWGIGRQWAGACYLKSIRNAWDLTQTDDAWIRKTMGAVGLRTVLELRGRAVHTLETSPAPRQSCCCSRSFGEATTSRQHVGDAVVSFATRAAEKIRSNGLAAGTVQVFLMTDRFRHDHPQHSAAVSVMLAPPTASTPRIIERALATAWADGFAYRKAGVLLLDLVDPVNIPRDLFAPLPDHRPMALMGALDAANRRFGRNTVTLGLAVGDTVWRMRQGHKSRHYVAAATIK